MNPHSNKPPKHPILDEESKEVMKAERNEQNSRSIHITGVDYSTTEQQLQDFFRLCGTILRVTIPKNANTGKPMGYGNIEFDNTNSVLNSLKLSGAILNGRKIIVSKKVYVPKSKRPTSNGFKQPFNSD